MSEFTNNNWPDHKWLPYMLNSALYCTCSDCNADVTFEDAKNLKECPVCMRPKEVDTSTWISYHGTPVATTEGKLYVCPNCLEYQCNGAESSHDINTCLKCGQKLTFSYEEGV